MYRSESTILVEPQSVPDKYVHATVPLEIDARIASLAQQILSGSNLATGGAVGLAVGLLGMGVTYLQKRKADAAAATAGRQQRMYVDSHCHLSFAELRGRIDARLEVRPTEKGSAARFVM